MRALILDVGGVFLLPSGERQRNALAPLGIDVDADVARDAWTRANADVDIEAAGPGPQAFDDEWRQRVYDALSLYAPAAEDLAPVESRWMAHLGVPSDRALEAMAAVGRVNQELWRSLWSDQVPGGREMLERARDAGLRLGCVSNSDGRVERELEEDGLARFFEVIIDSSVVGVAKPDPRIFGICLERMGDLHPEDCVYVGDTLSFDVAGATAAGLVPCHFDRLDLYPPAPALDRIHSLEDLKW